jgi:uncharacterized protein YbdZ (MbtH family)
MDEEDSGVYKVVVNHEEQYSIWPVDRENPAGWSNAGKEGPKAECLAHIETVWTDMRPLSLRKRMEELARNPPPPEDPSPDPEDDVPPLVDRLSTGRHPVEIKIRPEATVSALKDCLNRNYVHIKFTNTRGGTELGVRLDKQASVIPENALDAAAGIIHLEGTLTLDYVPVRCIADVDLTTFKGEGQLRKESVAG